MNGRVHAPAQRWSPADAPNGSGGLGGGALASCLSNGCQGPDVLVPAGRSSRRRGRPLTLLVERVVVHASEPRVQPGLGHGVHAVAFGHRRRVDPAVRFDHQHQGEPTFRGVHSTTVRLRRTPIPSACVTTTTRFIVRPTSARRSSPRFVPRPRTRPRPRRRRSRRGSRDPAPPVSSRRTPIAPSGGAPALVDIQCGSTVHRDGSHDGDEPLVGVIACCAAGPGGRSLDDRLR